MWRYGVLCFFFFQLITDFVAALYACGLLGTNVPPEIVCVLLLLSPLALLALRRGLGRGSLAALEGGVLLAAAVEPLLPTRGRLLVAGLGVALLLILLPALIWQAGRQERDDEAAALGGGLALGLALAILSRALNSGADPSLQTWYRAGAWALAAIGGFLVARRPGAQPAGSRRSQETASFAALAGWSIGLVAALALLYFAFASPNVIARWAAADYPLIVTLVTLALAVFAAALALAPARLLGLGRGAVLGWNVAFVAALVAALLAQRVSFPAGPAAYPLAAPAPSWLAGVPLVLACLLYPVLLLDAALYVRGLVAARPGLPRLGGSFALAGLFLLLMIFGQVFTTVYDYIPVIGPLFRDRFWLIFLALGLAAALPALGLRRDADIASVRHGRAMAGIVLAAGLAACLAVLATAARPAVPPPDRTALKVLTFNIQQGYSADGEESYPGQLELIRQVDPDVLGLQETDTNRISGGNSDIVRYFADRLNMHSYYGPPVGAGTFGIALLSRYPILQPETFYLYSQGEQTAAIRAQIVVGGRAFNVLVTHLGNDGPLVQQQAVLDLLAGLPNVIAMGDFNFTPATAQYRLTTAALADAWSARWPGGRDEGGVAPVDPIDHIFVSPGTLVRDARYLATPQSDHPVLAAEIGW